MLSSNFSIKYIEYQNKCDIQLTYKFVNVKELRLLTLSPDTKRRVL